MFVSTRQASYTGGGGLGLEGVLEEVGSAFCVEHLRPLSGVCPQVGGDWAGNDGIPEQPLYSLRSPELRAVPQARRSKQSHLTKAHHKTEKPSAPTLEV